MFFNQNLLIYMSYLIKIFYIHLTLELNLNKVILKTCGFDYFIIIISNFIALINLFLIIFNFFYKLFKLQLFFLVLYFDRLIKFLIIISLIFPI